MSHARTPHARTATWFDDVAFVTEAEHVRIDNENRFPRAKPKRRRRRSKAASTEPASLPHPSSEPSGEGRANDSRQAPTPSSEHSGV